MRKIIYILVSMFLITGCTNLSNTPTKKTEEFFKKYQTLDNEVIEDLNRVIEEELTFSKEQKDKYRDILKKHYQNITYEIKDDQITGDDAKVTVDIEVTDFNKALDEADNYLKEHGEEFSDDFGNYSLSKYIDYRLDKLKDAKEKVKYTIDIYLTKKDDMWHVNTPDNETLDKINGVYNY